MSLNDEQPTPPVTPKPSVPAAAGQEEGEKVSGETGADITNTVPTQNPLHFATHDLVQRFTRALAEKLALAERKYGYSDGWQHDYWMDECRQRLREHLEKGDPRDVAAYCAFLWHHGESTVVEGEATLNKQVFEGVTWIRDLLITKSNEGAVLQWAASIIHRCRDIQRLLSEHGGGQGASLISENSSSASLRGKEEAKAKGFEEWLSTLQAKDATPLPIWVTEKMKTAWVAAQSRLAAGKEASEPNTHVIGQALNHLEVIATADVSDMESRNHNAGPMKERAIQALALLKSLSSHALKSAQHLE